MNNLSAPYLRRASHVGADFSMMSHSHQDCLCHYDQDVANLQVIGLSRAKRGVHNNGKRFIAIGGKSDLQVLQVTTSNSADTDTVSSVNHMHEDMQIQLKERYHQKKQKIGYQVEDIQWNPSK